MSRLQRPQAGRTHSASSFAETFDIARRRLEETRAEQEKQQEQHEQSEEEEPLPMVDVDTATATAFGTPTSSIGTPPTEPSSPPAGPEVADDFAFAFDIDGVLVRGGQPIPEAIEAMKMLNGENEYGISVPYIFLTNGGGKTEAERCQDLSKQLDITISPGQFICGHTPMRELADKYTGSVLVVGGEGEKCRTVAELYGFRDVITPGDIIKANADVAPFRRLTAQEHANSRDLLARGRLQDIVIEAVFVFADSRDWASDLQIILDLATSRGGRLETRSETFDEGPPIYFSHSDVVWSAAHEHVRLGMGALRRIVETIFADITGGCQLTTHAFGKPQVSTFEFATRLLQKWRATQHGLCDSRPPATVYFVGDTPESDVRGTNAMDAQSADTHWYSILVTTGVYQDGTEPAYVPRATVPTVLDAVRHGIEREMQARRARQAKRDAQDSGAVVERLARMELVGGGDDDVVAV